MLLLAWCVGMYGRGYWTPDEPREADIAWRMSWQADRSVPLLAGEAFCEKPPLAYWLAAIPVRLFGPHAWAARLPNVLYALITALAVGLLARRSAGGFAALAAAAAASTFLLSYQVAIWLATDAPLLASVAVALLGAYIGFYATVSRERLRGYLLMHAALAVGFLSKSAAAWMVPALAIVTLAAWERRWRELIRWELYAGLVLQAIIILSWVWWVYVGPDGQEHLKVFFWNNLVGRFTQVDAPSELQYAAAHRNSPGKYLIELPVYLFPWTLLVIAAARRAWLARKSSFESLRPVRFALSASIPPILVLSLAATARNIYLAPALPGFALLLAWWARETLAARDRWDIRALRATAILMLISAAVFIAALIVMAVDARSGLAQQAGVIVPSAAGLGAAALLALRAWSAAPDDPRRAGWSLLLAYCALLVGPASQAYRQVDHWQNLGAIARAIGNDAGSRPVVLFAPDETTRAIIDMYARTNVGLVAGPVDSRAVGRLSAAMAAAPQSLVVAQLPAHAKLRLASPKSSRPAATQAAELPWLSSAHLRMFRSYELRNGRRYALLESDR